MSGSTPLALDWGEVWGHGLGLGDDGDWIWICTLLVYLGSGVGTRVKVENGERKKDPLRPAGTSPGSPGEARESSGVGDWWGGG